MGKTNKSNRTKGNTRPSSSGHTAQLLGMDGHATAGFIGFNTLEKETASFVPVTGQHVTDATDSSVDSDFRMVMRKMLKRDAVTRLKAIQEFGEYCVEKEKDIVKNVLPFWPRLFNRLSLDYDRRIREATHQSNGKLLLKVKKEMTPYLKNVMGVWLLGQCDLYPPAASVARSTFIATFPQSKQSDAVMFCRAEIFSYFKDNLFEQTAKSMSEPNSTTPEDIENKYILVISATLQALKLILSTVTPSELSNIQNEFSCIVAENKFWKFSKSKEAQIRGAWYTLISSICQLSSSVFASLEKKLATTVFGALSESDPMVSPSVWECALSIVTNFENCWQEIDIHKVALPQLWTILKEGGKGNARMLFPCLLPFLSRLPKEIVETEKFLLQFFSCFKQSMSLESVKMSSTECDAISVAFLECVQFICCIRLGDEAMGPYLLEKILINEVIPMIQSSLFDSKSRHLSTSKLYPMLGTLITKIENECLNENKSRSEAYSKVLTTFWDSLLPITYKIFELPGTEKLRSLVFINYFFHSLLQLSDSLVKTNKRSVRFKGDAMSSDELLSSNALLPNDKFSLKDERSSSKSELMSKEELPSKGEQSPKDGMPSNNKQFTKLDTLCKGDTMCKQKSTDEPTSNFIRNRAFISLSSNLTQSFQYIVKFSGRLCKEIDSNCQLGYLKLLEEIMTSASNEDFVRALVRECSKDGCYDSESALGFFQEVVLKLLKKMTTEDESLSCLFNLTLILCSFVSRSEAQQILEICGKMNVKKFEHLLQKGLTTYRNLSFFQNYIKSSHWFSEVVTKLKDLIAAKSFFPEAVSDTEISAYLRIIEVLLLDIDIRISDYNYERILLLLQDLAEQLFSTGLSGNKAPQALQFICRVTTAVLKNPERCWLYDYTENLIYLMFYSNTKLVDVPNSGNVVDALFEIEKCAIDSCAQAEYKIAIKKNLIYRMVKELASSITSLKTEREASNVLQHCSFFISSVLKALSKNAVLSLYQDDTLYNLIDTILPRSETQPTWKKEDLKINLLTSALQKRIFCPLVRDEKLCYTEESVICIMLHCDVISCIMIRDDLLDRALSDFFWRIMPFILWSLTFYKQCKMTTEVLGKEIYNRIEENYVKMLFLLPVSRIEELQTYIFNLSLLDGAWALCLETLEEIYPLGNLETFAAYQFEQSIFRSSSPRKNITKQLLIHYLPLVRKTEYFKELLKELIKELSTVYLDSEDGEEDSEDDEPSEDVAGKLGEICCYVQDPKVTQMTETADIVHLLEVVYNHNKDERDEHKKSIIYLQLIHLLPFVTQHNVSSLALDVLQFFLDKQSSIIQDCKNESFDTPNSLILLHHSVSLFTHLSSLHCAMADDVYMNLCEDFLNLFIYVANFFSNCKCLPESSEIVLVNLSKSVSLISGEQIMNIVMKKEAAYDENSDNGEHSILNKIISTLTTNNRPLQFAAQTVLLKIMPLLPSALSPESKTPNDDDSDEDIEKIPSKLSYLIEQLKFLNELVESMLSDVKIGDLCTVIPHTDSYVYVRGYLLGWIVMLEFIASSPSQIRSSYATHLEENKLLSSLFANVFRLMPENPMLCLKKVLKPELPKKENLKLLFLQPPPLQSIPRSSEEIQSIACYVFATALCKVPASIRTWWNNLDRKSADIVNSFTSKYISGLLCIAEIQAVHENEKQFENLTVQARPGSREVIATYTIDECPIELCVQLPVNYPLGPINAERRGKVVIGQLEWRHWLMQLTTVLTYQNGSILDGLTIWKRNLDKKFQGSEECMICYYILHNSTLKLPKLSCHVCRKKFHSACLYKWFSTSNNFTCPLCRNEFAM